MAKEEVKKEQKGEFPAFKGDGIENTKVTTLKEKVSLVLDRLRDLATMEIMLPSDVRMKKRMESIKKMSSADSIKVDGHWKTTAPKIHISNLVGRKINNSECEIRFGVFQTDNKGNKRAYNHDVDVQLNDGSIIKRTLSAEYKVAYEVIERITFRKPIQREIVRILDEDGEEQ